MNVVINNKSFNYQYIFDLFVYCAKLGKNKIAVKERKMSWYLKVLKQYARFHGRSRRKEYWYFYLFNFIIGIFIGIVTAILPEALATIISFIYFIYIFGTFLPGLGVSIRRLHDTNRSGWWILINLIPLIGALIFLYFTLQDSQPGRNRFGRNPKEPIE